MNGADSGFVLDDFNYPDLEKKFNSIKQVLNDSDDCEESRELRIHKLLQSCIEIFNDGKNALERVRDKIASSIIVTDLISYEIGVVASFKHCSESSVFYGDEFSNSKTFLTELFKKTSLVQVLFFSVLEKVKFDFTLDGDLNLLLDVLKHVWYGAKSVYNVSNKIMTSNWKIYITMSQKYSTELKTNIINDEPIDFLCAEIKKVILSSHGDDISWLKLCTYMMSVLVKLCSYGCIKKSHNTLVEFILFLNCHWLPDTEDAITIKDRLLSFVDELVLKSDETFSMVFHSICLDIIDGNSSSRKISALYVAMMLLKRYTKNQCDIQVFEIMSNVFQLIRCADSFLCCYSIDLYEPLLIHLASAILVSDNNLFEKIEKIVIKNILNTEYWPAMFSSDLWIIIMRYLTPDLLHLQFFKLASIFEKLAVFPCFTRCPQHIYIGTLLKRHFSLITDKKLLVNTCSQFKIQSFKSTIGILHVQTLSKYDRLSELIKMISLLPEQKNHDHLNENIIHLWSCVKDEHPSSFICALIEASIGSETLLKTIIPKTTKILVMHTDENITEMKRSKLRLIQSILLHMPTFQENLIKNIILEYIFDSHPMVQQWTIEVIVYFCSVTGNKNLISMLFKQSKIRTVITNYLEMKIDSTNSHNDCLQYFERLSRCGKFQHNCSFHGKMDKVLDKLRTNVDYLNDIVSKTVMSEDELDKLNECSSILSNICEAMQSKI